MDVVGGVKHYLFKKDEATTDNITFRIHYRVSFTILLACMGLVSCNFLLHNQLVICTGFPSPT
jgi:hypothetical protein